MRSVAHQGDVIICSLPVVLYSRRLGRLLLVAAAALNTALTVACSADASTIAGAITGNGSKRASGRVSLAVSVAGSGTRTLSGTTETKNELAQADLAFDLGEVQGTVGQIFKWDNAFYGGTAS